MKAHDEEALSLNEPNPQHQAILFRGEDPDQVARDGDAGRRVIEVERREATQYFKDVATLEAEFASCFVRRFAREQDSAGIQRASQAPEKRSNSGLSLAHEERLHTHSDRRKPSVAPKPGKGRAGGAPLLAVPRRIVRMPKNGLVQTGLGPTGQADDVRRRVGCTQPECA